MSNIITVGFVTEGPTDVRFLSNIIRRTFETVAFECATDIDVTAVGPIDVPKTNINDYVLTATQKAHDTGMMVVCVHADADDDTDVDALTHRINPAFMAAKLTLAPQINPNLVAVVPVRMTEAWMLADKPALKRQIDTTLSDADLDINRLPERIADPKACIKEAIRLSLAHRTKRHRHGLSINDLYEPMGVNTDLAQLASLPSYQKFQEAVRDAFRRLNYLH